MAISTVRTVAIDQTLSDPEWRFAQVPLTRIRGFAVIVSDEQGVEGHGYVRAMPPWTEPLEVVKASFDYLCDGLVGQDETAIGTITDGLDRRLHGALPVKAGIECALLDLRARALGVPLHDLYGGKRQDRFANTRIIPLKSPQRMAEVAAQAGNRRVLEGPLAADAHHPPIRSQGLLLLTECGLGAGEVAQSNPQQASPGD